MAGSKAADETPLREPASKRRRVSNHDSNISTPRFSSPDELTAASHEPSVTRRPSIRRRASRSPPGRDISEDELNGDYYARSRSRTREGESRSRSRRASSRTRSPYQSQSRSPSRSRSQSRSHSRSRLSPRSRSKSRLRSESRSSTRSDHTTPNSLSEQVNRQLRLSAEAPTPRRPPIKPNYQPYLSLNAHKRAVSQVRFSPDGRWIATASSDGTVKIWDADTGAHMDTLVGHMAGISCVAWSPDGGTLATGSDDKAIRLWDRVTARPKMSAKGLAGAKEGVARAMPPLLGHHNYVMCIAFSPKGNILASGSYDEAVFLWDVRAGRLMRSLPAHSDPVSGIDFCADGTLVASCSTDGLIRIWDTHTGQCLRTLVHEENPPVTMACFAPNGRYVLAFNLDNCIRLWDYVSGAVKKTYQGHKNHKFSIGGCFGVLALEGGSDGASADGAFVVSPSEDGDVVMWDVTTKEILQRLPAHPGKVCFWVDVRGDAMVTAGQDGTIRVFKHQRPVDATAAVAVNGDHAQANGQEEHSEGDVNGSVAPPPVPETTAETPVKVEEMDVDSS